MNTKLLKRAFFAIGIIGLAGLAVFTFSGVVMLLWNHILVSILHIGVITLWQAAGILLLSRILFGGFSRRGRGMHMGWKKKQMFMRWQAMTDDQKQQFRQEMHHCGRRWKMQKNRA